MRYSMDMTTNETSKTYQPHMTVYRYTVYTTVDTDSVRFNTKVARLLGCGAHEEIGGQLAGVLAELGLTDALNRGKVRIVRTHDGVWEPYGLREERDAWTAATRRYRRSFLQELPPAE